MCQRFLCILPGVQDNSLPYHHSAWTRQSPCTLKDMPNEQDSTAIVAIVIALIAFFVTTAQLLQTLFGTAVGYRQCQPSVIGGWAKRTRRKWRWNEFRFETIFTPPDIHLASMKEENYQPLIHPRVFITGDVVSRRETHCVRSYNREVPASTRYVGRSEVADDLVGWLSLLDVLHVSQETYFGMTTHGHTLTYNPRCIR